MRAAQALHARATVDAVRGRYDLSSRRLLHALGSLPTLPSPPSEDPTADHPDRESLGRVRVQLLVLLAGMEYELTGGEGGRQHLDEAVSVAEQVGARDLAFLVNQTLGLRATRSGLVDEALGYFDAAEALSDEATDFEVGKMLVNRGTLHLERLELQSARRDLELCRDRAAGRPELANLAMMAQHNLGYLEFLAGNLPAALRGMSEALSIGGDTSPAIALLDRARVLIAAGLIDAADHALLEAAEHFRRGRMWAYVAEAELARADCALMTGNTALARQLAGAARTRFRRRGNDDWRRRSELTLLAGDLAHGRPPTLLVGPASRVADEFAAAHLNSFARSARLIACEAMLASGQLDRAATTLNDLDPLDRTETIAVRLRQHTVTALLSLRRGKRGAARREIRIGLRDLGRHQAQFGSIDLQTASALHGRRLVAMDVEIALGRDRPTGVFAALERGRAVSRRLTPVSPPSAESAPLLTELRSITERLVSIGADRTQAELVAQLREQVADRQDQLHRIAWRSEGSARRVRPVGLRDAQDRLRSSDRQMVLFGRARDELFAVVVGARRPRLVPLSSASRIAEWVTRLRADLSALSHLPPTSPLWRAVTESAHRTLTHLDAALIEPLGLSEQRVVVVPTADLSTLAWNCLPSLASRPVEVSPTAAAWCHASVPTPPQVISVAAFAGPGLPASEREVRDLHTLWPGSEIFTDREATGRALTQTAGTVTVAHVAAHGTHVSQNPLFSSLHMVDGPLYAYELEADHLPQHVVLSACELGQATVRPGEETLGLTSVLLQLGVQCVVSGVADVNDDLAASVMVDYHRRLVRGIDAADALAGATADSGTVVPFVCFGATWSAAA